MEEPLIEMTDQGVEFSVKVVPGGSRDEIAGMLGDALKIKVSAQAEGGKANRAVCELLRDLSVIHNKTIVMVTHEPSVAAYAGEVAVLKDGRLVERFATEGTGNGGQALATRYQECLRLVPSPLAGEG